MINEIEQTKDHLRYLSIGFYIFSGFIALFSMIWLIYVVFGMAMMIGGGSQGEGGAVAGGAILTVVGLVIMGLFLTFAGLNVYAGRSLMSRNRWTFIFVVGCIDLVFFIPFGTILGIFTIILLMKEPTKQLFGQGIQQIPNTPPDWR